MYKINDLVQYGTDGICRITEIAEREFRDEKITYFVLSPVFNERSRIYVPCDNEELVSKMRYALSSKDITKVFKQVSSEDCKDWIDESEARKNFFYDIIHGGSFVQLATMIKSISIHRDSLINLGKRLHASDERFLKDAQKILYAEVAVAFDISLDDATEKADKFLA